MSTHEILERLEALIIDTKDAIEVLDYEYSHNGYVHMIHLKQQLETLYSDIEGK